MSPFWRRIENEVAITRPQPPSRTYPDGGLPSLQANTAATTPFLANPSSGPEARPVVEARCAIKDEAAPGGEPNSCRQQCPDAPFLAETRPSDARCRGICEGPALEAVYDADVQFLGHLPLRRFLGAEHEREGIRSDPDGQVVDHRRNIVDSELQMVRILDPGVCRERGGRS